MVTMSRVAAVLAALAALAACAGSTVESGALTEVPAAAPTTILTAPTIGPTVPADTSTVPPPTTPAAPTAPTTTARPVVPLTGWDAVDRYLDIAVVRGGSQAVSAAVMRDGNLLHQVALGARTGAEPVTTEDRFRVASISKTITAIVVLRLVEDGLLELDSPVGSLLADHLGASGAAGVEAITTRHLLTHRSGFAQYEELFFDRQVESCSDAARVGLGRSLRDEPGASFRYSNLNFCLLGLLIEQATGQPYEAVVDAQLLAPLGISGMRLAGTFDVGPGDVEHRSDPGRNYMEVLGAAGAWIATPTALVTILDSLDLTTPGFKPLGAAAIAEMTEITVDPPAPATPDAPVDPNAPPSTVPPAPESGYGMGLMIFGPGSHGHTGTVERTHAMFVHRPDGIVWAVTVSGDYPTSTRQLARIMDNALVLGGFSDGTLVMVPPPLD